MISLYLFCAFNPALFICTSVLCSLVQTGLENCCACIVAGEGKAGTKMHLQTPSHQGLTRNQLLSEKEERSSEKKQVQILNKTNYIFSCKEQFHLLT